MKKAIYRGIGSKVESLIGFVPEYMWKATSCFQGANKYGRYLVVKKDGRICEMYNTGVREDRDKSLSLFKIAVEVGVTSYINGREMTDTDLMDLYRSPWGIWYKLDEMSERDNFFTNVCVYTQDSDEYPLYFLDLNLEDRIELTKDGEIAGVSDCQYYDRIDLKIMEYVKEEEN